MIPIDFDESNRALTKPDSMTTEECSTLLVFTDSGQCISCWKPSLRERLSILLFGKVWLGIRSGKTQPPVWVRGARSIWKK